MNLSPLVWFYPYYSTFPKVFNSFVPFAPFLQHVWPIDSAFDLDAPHLPQFSPSCSTFTTLCHCCFIVFPTLSPKFNVLHFWYCYSMSPTLFTLLVHMSYTVDTIVPCLPHFYLVGPYVLHLWYCCSMSPTFFTLLLQMSRILILLLHISHTFDPVAPNAYPFDTVISYSHTFD